MARQPLQIVWFKRDLRVQDHRALAAAAEAGPALPLFVVEPELWAQPDMSARQWLFVRESLGELREALAALGQPLIVRVARVTEVLADLQQHHGIAALWSHEETGNASTYARDREVGAWAREHGVPWHEIRQNGVIRRLNTRDGWAKAWDRFMGEPVTNAPALTPPDGIEPGDVPTVTELGLDPDPCPERQRGGRVLAERTLETFLYERGEPYRSAMSSPISGEWACSRLSPYLAWGVLSMREVVQATWSRQRELKQIGTPAVKTWRGSMSSFSGRLHWRDHFTQKLEDEPRLEFENLHPVYNGMRPAEADADRLHAWAMGETGLPFVDACMRCLAATGWMNFRMRAMLMAVSSYHLWLDWRKPGEHLARQFTDYDAGIHWPQVQMQSGTTGINTVRIYNPVKQGYDQDPDGSFVRKWVPELRDVPEPYVHEPWKWQDADTVLDKFYPLPIVDHMEAAREARQKVYGLRRGEQFREGARAIQEKHGSRKSGIKNRGQRPSRPRKSTAQAGLPFDE